MNKRLLSILLVVVFVLTLLTVGCGGGAKKAVNWDKYPEKPINLIICYAPGGGSDVMLNAVRPYLEKELGKSFVPVYKPGANGSVGWQTLVQDTVADGYTICVSNSPPIMGNPIMSSEVKYTMADIVPVFNIVEDPGILVVSADSPIKTFADFIKYAKENPGKATVGNSGLGGDDWMATKIIEKECGIKLTAVAFQGDGPSWQAAMGGHVTASSNNLSIVYQQIKDKTLRPLVLYADQRSEYLPDVPTTKELGYNVISGSGRGFAAKKGTPEEALKKLEAAFIKATSRQEFKDKMKELGLPVLLLDRKGYQEYFDTRTKDFKVMWEQNKEPVKL